MAGTMKRLAISLFVVAHLVAIGIWNLPECPIRIWCEPYLIYYIYPTGQWQNWGMFAPDPPRESVAVEAIAMDRGGLEHRYSFPRLSEESLLSAAIRYRHAKYGSTMGATFAKPQREYAARYVLRKLDLQSEDYPVDLQLIYQLRSIPVHGTTEPVPVVPVPMVIETYRFPNIAETLP